LAVFADRYTWAKYGFNPSSNHEAQWETEFTITEHISQFSSMNFFALIWKEIFLRP
jgi:hypothetical protein